MDKQGTRKSFLNENLKKIKKWPIKKKRRFSLIAAILLTVLIIIFNFGINTIWKEKKPKRNFNNNSMKSFQSSFSNIFNIAKPALNQIFSSSTQTEKIIDQINSISSSSDRVSNVVEWN
jgi:hypothetical protein